VAVACVVSSVACGTETPQPPASSGGTPATGGQPSSGGTVVATGGTPLASGGTANSGGTSTGGSPTGGKATGGTSTGGKASGGTSTGGTATGGKAGGGTSAGGSPTGGTSTAGVPFILGADISRVQQDEDRGVTYSDNGVKKPILDILKAHGFNYIRLRTFVNPTASGGYSSQGYCDLAHTVAFGKRVKDAGMGLLVDFHYSDTWADPGTQTKPAAWANLAFDALVQQVHDYTKDAITQLKSGGARPDMVQIGNEIPSGMLFPDGQVSGQNFGNLNKLLNAGINGTHEVDSGIKIMLHIAFCQSLSTTTWWLDGVMGVEPKVKFDIFAQSCYDEANYQQPASSWEPNFQSLVSNSKYNSLVFAVAEYSQDKRMVNDMMFNLPNRRGLGTFIWAPEYWRETIFDWQGNTEVTNSNMSLYDQMATAYGLR
jgi:arabinogalactan endo-1,4-beta-galactosidase